VQLKTKDGQLTLGSAYKLIVWGWILSWGAFAGFVLILLILVAALSGQMMVNGEMVTGRGQALLSMLPLVVMFPVIITLQAFMFGAFLTFGLWIYRLRRPINVASEHDITT
jgi:hypothetical protein